MIIGNLVESTKGKKAIEKSTKILSCDNLLIIFINNL